MNKPMLTIEAVNKLQCYQCSIGDYCGHNCVENNSCSTICTHCNARVWFRGNIWKETVPETFTCPRCGETVVKKDH